MAIKMTMSKISTASVIIGYNVDCNASRCNDNDDE